LIPEAGPNPALSRFAACVEYDGAAFNGWQRQRGVPTVQESLENALSFVADHEVTVVCAGRTDTGVHATGQVVHFDSGAQRSCYGWQRGANTRLPSSVSVQWVQPVSRDFHARFSARRRAYRYIVMNHPARSALYRARATWDYRHLQPERMAQAATALVGRHDFSAFRALACQSRDPVKTLHRLDVHSRGRWIWFDVEADGFLHHMVRNIAGVLLAIGAGEADMDWCRKVLMGRDRRKGGVTAPPDGLYLVKVEYDAAHALPPNPPEPCFW
jgi:tRNA pseudouridine38-40 synthase